jgi:hypothetical protein
VDNHVHGGAVLREHHHQVTERDVIVTTVPNAPGAIGPMMKLMSDADVNVEYAYGGASDPGPNALMVFGVAMQTYGTKLADQQEVLTYTADILIDVYSAESALLRAIAAGGATRASLHADAARVFLNDAAARIEMTARQALAAMTSGDTLRTMLAGLRRLSKFVPLDTVTLRRRLADEAVSRGGYIF